MASRTGWLLWLDRLSITTRSPGASVGTSTSFTYARKRSPLMEPSSIRVAVTPLSRSPATSVVFFRLPYGIGARRRTPRGARPYRRAMLVVAKLSSTNTSRSGSRSSCPSNQSSRSSRTSGRFCSAAYADFFLKVRSWRSRKVQIVPMPARTPRSSKASLQFLERAVGFGLDRRQQEVAMRVELGAGPASLTACRALAAVAQTLAPFDCRRGGDLEPSRNLARRRSAFRRLDHPIPQILTVRSCHTGLASLPTMRDAPLPPSCRNPVGIWESPARFRVRRNRSNALCGGAAVAAALCARSCL